MTRMPGAWDCRESTRNPKPGTRNQHMHDDGPQLIPPEDIATPERVAQRLRAAGAILAEAGFSGARVEDQGETLLIQIALDELLRLQDEALRDGLVTRLKSLGYAFAAIDLTDTESSSPLKRDRAGGEGVRSTP